MTPEESYIFIKFGKTFYLVFIFSIVFIGCICIEKFIEVCRKYIIDIRDKNKDKQTELEELWEFLDGISEEEFKIIEKLIDNGNNPLLIYDTSYDYEFYLSNSIFTSSIMIISNHKKENEDLEEFYLGDAKQINREFLQYKVCKLKEDVYKILKKSKRKYRRISNTR